MTRVLLMGILILGWPLIGGAAQVVPLAPPIGVVVGADCEITWQASATKGVTAHRLYVSRTSGKYNPKDPNAVTVPMPTTRSTCSALKVTEDGQYYLVATAQVDPGKESDYSAEVPFVRSTSGPPPVVIVPPAPTDLQVASVDLKALTLALAWKPPQRADGSVFEDVTRYVVDAGVSPGVYIRTVYDGPERSAIVGNLQANQLYYVVVRAVKADGTMSAPSTELVVRPFPDLADTVPPTVRIQEIKQGATTIASGGTVVPGASVVVRIQAEDVGAIVDVELQVDGTRVCLTREVPYTCVWSVPAGSKQSYKLQAVARDQAGNAGQSALMPLTSR